jgi:DNA-binding response OmpR family regulator
MVAQQHIVVIEDHQALNAMICRVLSKAGHHVHGVAAVEDLQEYPALAQVDVFVVDWNLPGESGIDFIRRMRGSFPLAGIVMMTARSGNDQQLQGYASGADFYLSKPVRGEELLRAVDILHARSQQRGQVAGSLGLAPAIIRRDRLTLEAGDVCVRLTIQDVRLLAAFAVSPTRALEGWQLAEILDPAFTGDGVRAIEVRVSRLRKKLIAALGPGNHLPYVRGEGYRLNLHLAVH